MELSVCIRSISVAHAFVLDQGQRCAYPNGRGQYGAVYAVEGEAEYRFVSGARRTVNQGELMLLSDNAAYTVHAPHIFRHYTVNFEIFGTEAALPFSKEGFCLLSAPESTYLHHFERAAALWKNPSAGREMAAMASLYEILSLVAEALSAGEKELWRARLSPAQDYLCAHFREPVSNAQLAALCNMSETHFRREWRRVYAQSPLSYRDALRLARAKALLLGGTGVTETARECGFEDESYFVRFFKKQTAITPGTYRKRFAIL